MSVLTISRRLLLQSTIAFFATTAMSHVAKALEAVPEGEDRFSSRIDETKKTQTIEALDLTIEQKLFAIGDYAIIVRADTIRLAGEISLPGQGVRLICRQLICAEGSKLSTKGGSPKLDFTDQKALNGPNAGENGADGQNGSDGQDGGAVEIYAGEIKGQLQIDASGGNGGAAESGGDGAPGRDGGPFQPGLATAEPGHPGGVGGLAGKPGNGGSAQNIAVTALLHPTGVAGTTVAGHAGAQAKHGQSGNGGQGGGGGSYETNCRRYGSGGCGSARHGGDCREPREVCETVTVSPGSPGSTPSGRPEPIPQGVPGNEAKVTIGKGTPSDIVDHFSGVYVGIVLHGAERDYVNNRIELCLFRLNWLAIVLSSREDGNATNSSPMYSPALRRTRALLAQVGLGLDYYAEPYNFVPLLSVKYYTDNISQLLHEAEQIEKSYLAYRDASNDKERAIGAISEIQIASVSKIESLKSNSSMLVQRKKILQKEIDELLAPYEAAWTELFASERQFRVAVAAQRGGNCSFKNLILFVGSVATLVTTGKDVFNAIKAADRAFANGKPQGDDDKPIEGSYEKLEFRIKRLKNVGNRADEFLDAFNSVSDLLGGTTGPGSESEQGEVPAMPGDQAKIVASAEAVEEALQPYLNLPEAQTYRSKIRAFVAIAQSRNNKLIEYDASTAAWFLAMAEIDRIQVEVEMLQTQIAEQQNPFIIEARIFMESAWLRSRTALVKILHKTHRAYRYYALVDDEFSVEDFAVAALAATATTIRSQYIEARQRQGTDRKEFEALADCTAYLSDRALTEFKKTGRATFAVAADNPAFRHHRAVLVSQVVPKIKKADGSSVAATAVATHHGTSLIVDQVEARHSFVHAQLTALYEEGAGGRVLSKGVINEGDFVGVSPFATWTVTFQNEGDFKEASGLVLEFTGRSYTVT